MKKLIPFAVGLLFLIIDIPIKTGIAFPAFIHFVNAGPETVDMIINQVIGKYFTIDIAPDIIGYVLMIMTAVKLIKYNMKFGKCVILCFLSGILSLAYAFMPFFFNGEYRFTLGFILYFAYAFFKVGTVIICMLTCLSLSECTQNHSWNNVVGIFMILCSSAGLISHLARFYQLPRTCYLYFGVEIFFAVLSGVMFYLRRNYLVCQQS